MYSLPQIKLYFLQIDIFSYFQLTQLDIHMPHVIVWPQTYNNSSSSRQNIFSQCRCCRLCQFKIDGTLLSGYWYTILVYCYRHGSLDQYCQDRNINILNRVCRELTRLSRSKHTLVNILTIGEIEHPQMTHHFETTENSTQPKGI